MLVIRAILISGSLMKELSPSMKAGLDAVGRMADITRHTWDVVAENIKTGERRFLAQDKTEENADGISNMAVTRCGCDEEFYMVIPHVE